MAAQVLSFFQRTPRFAPAPATDWTQQELAEFYRVEAALIRAGIRVGTDRGLSDENEPWFVFYRTDDGEVVIHFARIDGEYLIAGPAYEEIARGFDFTTMVRNMVARHPLIRRSDRGDNISIHPAALLVAVVGTAFFKTGEARAAESGAANPPAHARPTLLSSSSSASLNGGVTSPAVSASAAQPAYDTVQLPANQAVLVLAAALLASDFGVDTATLDPAASAAIASAAASASDFSAPTSLSFASESSAVATTVGEHAQAVANTPAEAVSSVLSLVALLSTLPHASEIPAAPEATLTVAEVAPERVNITPLPAPAAHDTADWSLQVRLGAGGLPNVEAVQLVRALVGDTAAQKITVIEVSKLPDVLAEIISRGDHYQVGPITTPTATDPNTPATTETVETPASPGATAEVTPKPVVESHTTTIEAGVVSVDLVKAFISFYTEHTNHIATYMNGAEVVMVDTDLMGNPAAMHDMTIMNFDFADGSSISLIGAHSAFLNGGLLF